MIDLKETGKRIRAQDNRATAHPLFIVFEKERIYGVDPDFHDEAWSFDYEHGEKVYYIDRNRFVCAHFTEVAADRYILENAHNLENPFVYAASMYRCHEMIAIGEFLMGLSERK